MKAFIFGAVVLGVLVAGASFASALPGPVSAPAAAATPAWPYTLYGSFSSGWGFTSSSLTKPGPTLTVTTGDVLALKLLAVDGTAHNWTIDLNNDSIVQGSEPHSVDFSSASVPVFYNLTIALTPGLYTYRCGLHPSQMWGELVVLAAPTFTLWGSSVAPNGWGLTNSTITFPGPTLNANQGQTVSIDLFSADGADHTFYVDFARSSSTSGNTVSPVFSGSHSLRFTFVASSAGNFTYACGIHGAGTMAGTLHVAGSTTPPPAGSPDYTLYAAVVLVIAIVAIATVVLIRRRPRTPPAQPPAEPPQ